MNSRMDKRMRILRLLATLDDEYMQLQEEYKVWEEKFTQMAGTLTKEQQDVAWGYVCTSDALDHRLLEIACELLDLNKV